MKEKIDINYINDQSSDVVYQKPGEDGMWTFIEKIARICKGTQDHMSNDSKAFAMKMFDRGEESPLEQGTVYLFYPAPKESYRTMIQNCYHIPNMKEYLTMYNTAISFYNDEKHSFVMKDDDDCMYISTNARVLAKNEKIDDLKFFDDKVCMERKVYGPYYVPRVTLLNTINLQVAQEMTRHRNFSYMAESTRAHNYKKDKHFDFIVPLWLKNHIDKTGKIDHISRHWISYCHKVVEEYLWFLGKPLHDDGSPLVPQDVASGLTRDFAQNIYMTGFVTADSWTNFFNQRFYEKTGKVLPMMKDISTKMHKIFEDNDYFAVKDFDGDDIDSEVVRPLD